MFHKFNIKEETIWIHVLITVFFLILVPIFVFYSYKNDLVKDALRHGWSPIIMAMIISRYLNHLIIKNIFNILFSI
jgi:hypothetical protein